METQHLPSAKAAQAPPPQLVPPPSQTGTVKNNDPSKHPTAGKNTIKLGQIAQQRQQQGGDMDPRTCQLGEQLSAEPAMIYTGSKFSE